MFYCSAEGLHFSAFHYVAVVGRKKPWRSLWDLALDRGPQGTKQLQQIIYQLSHPVFGGMTCDSCGDKIEGTHWFQHLCNCYPASLRNDPTPVSENKILSALQTGDSDFIFNLVFKTL